MDLILSSGFLAFARHTGFLDVVEPHRSEVRAIVGTSSGALVGALWAAGHSSSEIAKELTRGPPLDTLRLSFAFWRGLFSMHGLIARLSDLLPANVTDLPIPFAVGVQGPDGKHALLTTGPLPSIVAASCAMPYVFAPVVIDGASYADGGAVDRLGIAAWRSWRSNETAWVHHVQRTAGVDVQYDGTGLVEVLTPKSRARFWSLGDFEGERSEAAQCARKVLAANR